MRSLLERFRDDGEIREALLMRPWLPGAIRSQIVRETASRLIAFTLDRAWLSPERAARLAREARDKANVSVAAETARGSGRKGLRAFVSHLRSRGELTASLMLRALLSGRLDFFEAALVELSGLSEARVASQLSAFRGAGFAAVYAEAGLPDRFLTVFRGALEALGELDPATLDDAAELRVEVIQTVLVRCDFARDGELKRLIALLRRLEMEAEREAARARAPALSARSGRRRPAAPLIDMRALEEALAQAA